MDQRGKAKINWYMYQTKRKACSPEGFLPSAVYMIAKEVPRVLTGNTTLESLKAENSM